MRSSRIITVSNHKGGTGKTTSTLNVGKALSNSEVKCLLVDIDSQANLSQSLRADEEVMTIADALSRKIDHLPIKVIDDFLHIVPASLELSSVEPGLYSNFTNYFLLKQLLDKVRDNYDFIIIDCPPSLGILTQNALIASDSILITVQSQFLSLKGLNTIYNLVQTIQEKLNPTLKVEGLLLTQTNNTRLSKDIVSSLKKSFQGKVFSTTIRQNISLAEASASRQDIFSYKPNSYGAIDYMNLAKEILL
jgi:chromosome partitioning protein